MLLSGNSQGRKALRDLFAQAGWTVLEGERLIDLKEKLLLKWTGVVISDFTLPDASWRTILSTMRSGCELIVISPFANDKMWTELLDAGAFDLLSDPPEPAEILRVAAAASRQVAARSRADMERGAGWRVRALAS